MADIADKVGAPCSFSGESTDGLNITVDGVQDYNKAQDAYVVAQNVPEQGEKESCCAKTSCCKAQ